MKDKDPIREITEHLGVVSLAGIYFWLRQLAKTTEVKHELDAIAFVSMVAIVVVHLHLWHEDGTLDE